MLKNTFSPWPSFSEDEANAVKKIILSNKVNYWTGEECRIFEKDFAKFTNCKYAVALSNGTVALDLALKAINIKTNDEVIVTPRTFIASASSILNVGATPVFADVDQVSGNVNAETIKKVITSKTKAIICVHIGGWPCEMDDIIKLAKDNKLKVIEDCSQAHGALYKGKSVGSFGDVSTWSFCQDKIITTIGEGGMVTTNDKRLWSFMWSYKDHGKSWNAIYKKNQKEFGFKWVHERVGTNWRMTEVQAKVGRIQLSQLKKWNKIRNKNAKEIFNVSKKFEGIITPVPEHHINHAYYKVYIYIKESWLNKGWTRDKILIEMQKLGVPCGQGICSEVYLEKTFKSLHKEPIKRLPVAKKLGEVSLMFLVHPTLTKEEINQTKKSMLKIFTLALKT